MSRLVRKGIIPHLVRRNGIVMKGRVSEDQLLEAGKSQTIQELPVEKVTSFFQNITVSNEDHSSTASTTNLSTARQIFDTMTQMVALPSDFPQEEQSINPADKVELLLEAFKNKQTSILPRIDILNEAIKALVAFQRFDKAANLVKSMETDYGIKPNGRSMALLADAYIKAGQHDPAAELLSRLSENEVQSKEIQEIYQNLIRSYFEVSNDTKAWQVFNELRSKCLPDAQVVVGMLHRCGKMEQPELALKLYKEITAQGMPPNSSVMSHVIYPLTKNKRYFAEAIDLFHQMELMNMEIKLPVYNNLLFGCSKTANLETAMAIWKKLVDSTDQNLKPNVYTCSNYIWALASVETKKTKLSVHRRFTYDVEPSTLIDAANQTYEYVKMHSITVNSFLLSALLAVYSNNFSREMAEKLFWEEYELYNIPRSPFTYELMFKMYDSLRCFEGAVKIYKQSELENQRMPYEGWRALIRSAALSNHLEDSMELLLTMKKVAKLKPHFSDFIHVNMRYLDMNRPDLSVKLKENCIYDPKIEDNPFIPNIKRSQAVSKLLHKVYGDKAPTSQSLLHNLLDKDK